MACAAITAVLCACNSDALQPGGPPISDGGATDALPPSDLRSGDDAAPACGVRPADRVEIRVKDEAQPEASCGSIKPGGAYTIDVTGVVVRSQEDQIVVDTCPAWAPCKMPRAVTFTIRAPRISLADEVATGSFVRVRADLDAPWGCIASAQVRSVATWAGKPEPIGTGNNLLLAVADGTTATYPDAGFTIAKIGLGCNPGQTGCGGDKPDDYLLRFTGGLRAVDVRMGAVEAFNNGEPLLLVAHNYRSYQTTICDDYWNWSWAVAAITHPGG